MVDHFVGVFEEVCFFAADASNPDELTVWYRLLLMGGVVGGEVKILKCIGWFSVQGG